LPSKEYETVAEEPGGDFDVSAANFVCAVLKAFRPLSEKVLYLVATYVFQKRLESDLSSMAIKSIELTHAPTKLGSTPSRAAIPRLIQNIQYMAVAALQCASDGAIVL
jgi:hypothetical protein